MLLFDNHGSLTIHDLVMLHLLVELALALVQLLEGFLEDQLVAIRGILEHSLLLVVVGFIFFLLAVFHLVEFVLDLLTELIFVDVFTLGIKVKPVHVGAHGVVAELLNEVLDVLEQKTEILSLLDLRSLMLILAPVVSSKVRFTGINQVELDIEVEVVQVIFLRVDQFALEVDEVVLGVEEFFALVMDVHGKLVITVGSLCQILDVPALMEAETDGD